MEAVEAKWWGTACGNCTGLQRGMRLRVFSCGCSVGKSKSQSITKPITQTSKNDPVRMSDAVQMSRCAISHVLSVSSVSVSTD